MREATAQRNTVSYTPRTIQSDFKAPPQCSNQALESRSLTGYTPLLYASIMGHAPVVRILVDQNSINVNCTDSLSQTPLIHAAKGSSDGVVTALLKAPKIDVNWQDSFGQIALAHAAFLGCINVVNSLLGTRVVDVNRADMDGRVPISLAAQRGHATIVQVLLGADNVNIDLPDKDGRTALFYAASNGDPRLVRILLEERPSAVFDLDRHGQSLLHVSVINRRLEVVEYLLAIRKWDVHAPMRDDWGSILMCASHDYEFVPLLWRHCGCNTCSSARAKILCPTFVEKQRLGERDKVWYLSYMTPDGKWLRPISKKQETLSWDTLIQYP